MRISTTAAAIALIACLPDQSRADFLAFGPRHRYAIAIGIENLEQYSEFDFYVHQVMGQRTWRIQRIDLRTLTRIAENGGPGDLSLIALPRGNVMPAPEEFDKSKPLGLIRSERLTAENNFVGKDDNGSEYRYRVRINGERITAELVDVKRPMRDSLGWLITISVLGVCTALAGTMVIIMRRLTR